jgi:hypothetical protein
MSLAFIARLLPSSIRFGQAKRDNRVLHGHQAALDFPMAILQMFDSDRPPGYPTPLPKLDY